MATGGTPHSAASSKRLNAALRAEIIAFCYEKKLQCLTLRQIQAVAEPKFGRTFSPQSISNWIKAGCKDRVDPLAEQYRQVENDKLDTREHDIHAALQKAKDKEPPIDPERMARLVFDANDKLVKIGKRRSELNGWDAPTQFSSNVTVHYSIDGVDQDDLR